MGLAKHVQPARKGTAKSIKAAKPLVRVGDSIGPVTVVKHVPPGQERKAASPGNAPKPRVRMGNGLTPVKLVRHVGSAR